MPPWSVIDTVMFDMDGTLLDLHFDNYFWLHLIPQKYAQNNDISEEEALGTIRSKYEEVHGTLNWYCLDYWERELQLDIPALKDQERHRISIRPNVERLLRELRFSDKRLLLITNAHPKSLTIKTQQTGIGEFFHQCVSSHQLKLAKENRGFWEKLQIIESYDPERTLLFDDSLPVLRQAQSEGIRHLYGIKFPDSQRPEVEHDEFPLIEDFQHIMPSKQKRKSLGQ